MPSERPRSPSASSPIPKINVNGSQVNLSTTTSNNNNDLLNISNSRINGSTRDKSPSRDRSPSRNKSPNNKRGKSPSFNSRPKSPSSPSLDTPKNSNSNRSRNNFDDLQQWLASSPTGNKISNRLSLPTDPSELNSVIRESNERWAKLNLISSDNKDGEKGSMGNFHKPLRIAPISQLYGSKSMQRNPSDQPTGRSNDSSPLIHGGFTLARSRSFNSAIESNNNRVSTKFSKEVHPLQHSWTMYYDSKPAMTPGPKTPTGKTYEENLQTIGSFKSVQTFCRYFNWVKKPSQLDSNTNFHIFKDKIKPMWEDPANANVNFTVNSQFQVLDRSWEWLVYALVGEELDENDDICGAVMSRRPRGDRIAVWVRDKDNVPVINGIGKRLLKILDLQNENIGMDFQFNEDALKSGTSYNNRTYLSLESLKQELENAEKERLELSKKEEQQQNQQEMKDNDNKENSVTIRITYLTQHTSNKLLSSQKIINQRTLPTVEKVKEWEQDDIINFLQEKREELNLEKEDIKIIGRNRVSGDDFLKLSLEDPKLYGIPFGSSKRIIGLIKKIKDQQRVSSLSYGQKQLEELNISQDQLKPSHVGTSEIKRPVYIFVDNSNFFIQGRDTISNHENLDFKNNHIIFDYSQLLKLVKGKCELGNTPIIVGSYPPPYNSLWKNLEKSGYEIKVFDRKTRVNIFLTLKMSQVFYRESHPGILILIAGDGNYYDILLEAIKFKWKVEVWFWKSGISSDYVNDNKINYTPLETCYKFFSYGCGPPDHSKKMESLRIISDKIIQNQEIIEGLAALDLFCWLNREKEIISLYFNNKIKLNKARKWIENEYKDIVICEKKIDSV
ncbi:4751_t:CDS:10 [Diversispora eburnea]|uniref:4751_t:CDS:1 n=1 Tax=Diversispora eburnea TaxID=1213867 RepID=A0A9N9AQB5_9GLOM|nr:4751_t:CDS:10 [Diversispora eburnea]